MSYHRLDGNYIKMTIQNFSLNTFFTLVNSQVARYLNTLMIFLPKMWRTMTQGFLNLLKWPPLWKKIYRLKAIWYIGPKFWDDMPIQLKQKQSRSPFKHDLKKYYLTKSQLVSEILFYQFFYLLLSYNCLWIFIKVGSLYK